MTWTAILAYIPAWIASFPPQQFERRKIGQNSETANFTAKTAPKLSKRVLFKKIIALIQVFLFSKKAKNVALIQKTTK